MSGLSAATLRRLKPLPPLPPVTGVRKVALAPPALPRTPPGWHVAGASLRFAAAFRLREPLGSLERRRDGTRVEAREPLIVPAGRVPAALRDAAVFRVIEATASGTSTLYGQRDLDGNVVFVPSVRSATTRLFWLYPVPSAPTAAGLFAGKEALGNDRLTVSLAEGKLAREIRLRSGYRARGDEAGGILTASYQDTAGGWPRTDTGATLLASAFRSGPAMAQYRSRVAFGRDRAVYETTFTVYAHSPRIGCVGRWISAGAGATKQVNLGDSFPEGTVVAGPYGRATLPAAGASYGRAALIRPADNPKVTAVLASPDGTLSSPGWAPRSVVGAGMWYQTAFPATVRADYWWYETPPAGDPAEVARRHYLRSAFPPALTLGRVERRRG